MPIEQPVYTGDDLTGACCIYKPEFTVSHNIGLYRTDFLAADIFPELINMHGVVINRYFVIGVAGISTIACMYSSAVMN